MTIANFIPTVWSPAMLMAFQENAVAAGLTNRTYEGDAASGNTVKVTTGTPVSIKNYAAGVISDGDSGTIPRTTAPDPVATTQVDLLIDQEKSFDFLIDDIDRRQAAGSLDVFATSAGQGLVDDADTFILAQIYAAGTALTAAALADGDAAFDKVRDLRKALRKNHVPNSQLALVINAEYEALLVGADSKLTAMDVSGTTDGLRNASIGRLLGFDVYVSENLPNVAKPQAVAFHTSAYAFVSQITETEAMRDTNSFSDRLRGLHVYGGKAVRPAAIAAFTAS
jgi:hypothetical protein